MEINRNLEIKAFSEKMKYFFILGNHPSLSAAEIAAVLGSENPARVFPGNVLVYEAPATDIRGLIKRLGGTIKAGAIIEGVPFRREIIKEAILKIIEKDLSKKEGKYCFGFSYYGKSGFDAKLLGLEIKRNLKERAVSARFVVSREKTLSSVVVEQNGLVDKGLEAVLIEGDGEILIGRTIAVQDFKGLSARDYGRPGRDDASGMLPPKLAQIMLNLSGKIPFHCNCSRSASDKQCPVILDPFCGSGTVLTEAALMGVENLVGADISAKAIEDTKTNTDWLSKNYKLQSTKYKFFNIPAERISEKIQPNSVDAIVTEPYLGPQRGWHDIRKTIQELEKSYSAALAEFKKILKNNGVVVMVFPVFTDREGRRTDFINPDINGWQVANPLNGEIRSRLKTTPRGAFLYGREGQKVWREIVILKLK